MEAGAEDLQPHSPSIQHPTDQPPTQPTSGEERGSEVEETLSPDKDHTVSSPLRQSQAQTPGSAPKTNHEDNSKDPEPEGATSCLESSGSDCCSSPERSWKRKSKSRDRTCDGTGASPDECSVSLEKEREKVLAEGHSSESEKTRDASPRRSPERHPGGGKRPRSRSPGDQPPPLRKHLVTSLRTMSEAICQNMLQVYHQQGHSPPTREQLAQLRGPLFAAVHTFYAMANQAAYVFPADSWLVPTPLPEPQGPAKDGGEAQGCKDSPPRPQTACQ